MSLPEQGMGYGHGTDVAPIQTPSLAYKLWIPLRIIVMNPMIVFGVYVVFNLVFITTCLIIRALIAILTLPGFFLVLAFLMAWGLRIIICIASFPGQLQLVVRDGEASFAKVTKRRLGLALDAANELATALATQPTSTTSTSVKRAQFLELYQNFNFSLETLIMPLQQALVYMEKNGTLGPNGTSLLSALRDFTVFCSKELRTPCTELSAALPKEFDAKRQELFLSSTSSSFPISPRLAKLTTLATSSTPSWTANRMVATFYARIQGIRSLLPLIGGSHQTVGTIKKDFMWILRELSQQSQPKVDTITTLDLMRADMAIRFHGEQVWISSGNVPPHHQVDSMFLPARDSSSPRPAILLCNPNGGLYEFHHFQMDWVQFYTQKLNCHVMLFNYRGYGRNKGSPSPAAHTMDALAIIRHLKADSRVTKIAVHGESIGGMVATAMGATPGTTAHSSLIDVLIADRTFASLPALGQRLVAKWAGSLITKLTWWETPNAQHYLNAKCPKILCSDPDDAIILDGASLKTGVALLVELEDSSCLLPPPLKLETELKPKETQGRLNNPVLTWIKTTYSRIHDNEKENEPDTRLSIGFPLTEKAIRRFSECALSLGRRAMQYAAQRDQGTQSQSRTHVVDLDETESTENSLMLSSSEPLAFPPEILAMVWMLLACLDGYCGQCFLQAADRGDYDRIRAWTVSLLAWGTELPHAQRTRVTTQPFERQQQKLQPLTLESVHSKLKQLAAEHPSLVVDPDLHIVCDMINFLYGTLHLRWKQRDEQIQRLPREESSRPSMGHLLTLHCGHNRNYGDKEKEELITFLHNIEFLS